MNNTILLSQVQCALYFKLLPFLPELLSIRHGKEVAEMSKPLVTILFQKLKTILPNNWLELVETNQSSRVQDITFNIDQIEVMMLVLLNDTLMESCAAEYSDDINLLNSFKRTGNELNQL